ncbi:hypothetical protein ACW73O_11670 [Faecalibacterium prausnitzii]
MKRLTNEEFLKRIKAVHGEDIKVLGEYVNRRTKIKVKHKCGFIWDADPTTLTNGHSCPKCSNNIKKTTEKFKKEVYDLVGDEYTVLGEYKTTHTKILMRHNVCNCEFEMAPKNFIHSGQRCPNEAYKRVAYKNTIPFEVINEKMEETTNGEYKIVNGFTKTTNKANILHVKCNRIFRQKPTRIIKGGIGCPYCYKSKGEDVIEMYLQDKGYAYKTQYKIKECRNIRTLPFDFAVFKDGKLDFLIEYDGIQHFKPKFGKKQFEQTKINDSIKNAYCKEKGITLIRIKYNRSENPNIFKNKIYAQLDEKLNQINKTIPSQAL